MNTLSLTAARIARDVAAGSLSAEAVTRAHLDRIKALEPKLRAFLNVLEQPALIWSKVIDKKRQSGQKLGRLAGVPVAIKDNIMLEGIETTCASKILKGHRSAYSADVVDKLLAEDAVIIGKTNLDEFAMGSSTENSAFQKTTNPWDTACVPGGSSGGSAAAVAAGLCAVSLGSDTGGSIRQPAAFCGVVGLKPTYGLVSRYGLVAFASSLDQIGPFCRTVEDAALVLSVLSGHDKRDSTSSPVAPFNASLINGDVKGLRIGMPKEYFIKGTDPEVEKAVRDAVAVLEAQGAKVVDISLPHTSYAVGTYYIIAPSEASSNLARFDGVRFGYSSDKAVSLEDLYELSRGEGFGPEVKRRIMLGTYALSSGYYDAYYGKAQRVRTLIADDFKKAFRNCDVIAGPTAPTPAFRFGEKSGDPMAMYLSDIFTIPSNMAGNASVSVPCGTSSSGLPIGLQLIADVFREDVLLKTAQAYEKVKPFASCPV